MKSGKKNQREGEKDTTRNPSEYDKGKERYLVENPVGQDNGDDETTLGCRPTTNLATAGQYPGCTHVSSIQG
jgi:hypothetical protein